jgi:DNA-binding FadR family transcriptional regulator
MQKPLPSDPVDTPLRAIEPRAADAVVAALEQDIVGGIFANGSPLPPERDLMGRFGISRTVVREAIATLTTHGLLESKPRHRPIVRRPGYDAAFQAVGGVVSHLLRQDGGVKTLFDLRIFLEASLVRHAALDARKEDIAELRAALEANGAAIDDPVQFDNTDVAFHAIFYRILGNPVLPAVHRAFVTWLFDHWRAMNRSPEQNLTQYAGHKAIFDAIIDRDPDAAEQALRAHLGAAWERVRSTF